MDRGQEGLKITHKVKWEAKPSRFVAEFRNTFLGVVGVGVLHVLRRVTLAVGNVAVEYYFGAERVQIVVADMSWLMSLGSACDEA